jgi:16S rRNA processing protein RimM
VELLSDFPERFEDGAVLWLQGEQRTIERVRWQKGALYLKLSGIDDPDTAEELRAALLEVPEDELTPLDDDEFYHHELIGLRVETVAGVALGEVREVLATGSNAVLVIGTRGETLLPFIDDVVESVDLDEGLIVVDPLDEVTVPADAEAAEQSPTASQRRRQRRAARAPHRD